MKKTVIVEFNGLAGLGKTTIANALNDELQKDGYNVIGNYRHSFFHSLRPLFCILYSFSLYRLVKRYADSIVPYKKDRVYTHWTNHFVRMYKSIVKYSDADFAIIDEAIIQFLVAMGLSDHLPKSELLNDVVRKIKTLGVSFVRVDCVNNIESACERIQSRPAKGMYYENWTREELIKQLKTEADNFALLRETFSNFYPDQLVIIVDTLNSPEENAKKIINTITNI